MSMFQGLRFACPWLPYLRAFGAQRTALIYAKYSKTLFERWEDSSVRTTLHFGDMFVKTCCEHLTQYFQLIPHS